tara:strand:+ start:435 stop:566 length:132 start_codon:yes stop_codon:yes gene_type:complete
MGLTIEEACCLLAWIVAFVVIGVNLVQAKYKAYKRAKWGDDEE